jgi:hypothetical protein
MVCIFVADTVPVLFIVSLDSKTLIASDVYLLAWSPKSTCIIMM